MFLARPIQSNKEGFILQYRIDNEMFNITVSGVNREAVIKAYISNANTYVQLQIETLDRLLRSIKHHYFNMKPPLIDHYANWKVAFAGFRMMVEAIKDQGELQPEKMVEVLGQFNYDFNALIPLLVEHHREQIQDCVEDLIHLPKIIHKHLRKQKAA